MLAPTDIAAADAVPTVTSTVGVPVLSSKTQYVTVKVTSSASPALVGETSAFFNHGVSVSTENETVRSSTAESYPSLAVIVAVRVPPSSVVKSAP